MTKRKFTVAALATVATLGPATRIAEALQRRADLTITGMGWSEDAGASWSNDPVFVQNEVLFRATVRNSGAAALSPSMPLLIEWRANGSLVASATLTGGLSRRQSTTVVAATSWTPDVAGNYTIEARADPANTIFEGNESNNRFTLSLVVESNAPVPVANNDTASTTVNTPVTIDVLANDTGPGALVIAQVQSPTDRGGTAVITRDGKSIQYTPPIGFQGDDTFAYGVNLA